MRIRVLKLRKYHSEVHLCKFQQTAFILPGIILFINSSIRSPVPSRSLFYFLLFGSVAMVILKQLQGTALNVPQIA